MKNTWIVIANETKASIYSADKGNIGIAHTIEHPDGRLQDRALLSDRPGSSSMPTGTGNNKRATFNPRSDQHQNEQQNFAREVAKFLEKANGQHDYHDLIICAEPHFYGVLKNELTANVVNSIKKNVLKDYIPFPENKLKEVLKEIIKPGFQPTA